ncbi:MAG: NAD(+) diphosphatase [Rhodobacteraceae bacterium]|nr:NAD(+) diphosphatase [Paracoccaceae bacterium]
MEIAETVTFGGSQLDRAAQLRGDSAALAELAALPGATALVFWRGKVLVSGEGVAAKLVRLPLGHVVLAEVGELQIFLGREGAQSIWAYDISPWQPEGEAQIGDDTFFDPKEQPHPALDDAARFVDLRAVFAALTPREAELAAMAKALISWHGSHGYCAKCGAKSDVVQAGWQRQCATCNTSHFPRTDPVVIMLITRGNSVLLGRSPMWREGMYSLLAGFVEPGETIEAAVRREVLEESSIKVGKVGYLASQPWPFPASIMIGCEGEALSDEITIDPVELEAAMWVSRERMALIFAGQDPEILAPRFGAIAHFLLWNWLADRLD